MSVASSTRTAETASSEPVRVPERSSPKLGFLTDLSFAAHFEAEPYGEIARDPSCGWKVSLVVAAAGLAHGVAFYSAFGPSALVVGTLGALGFWLVLSSVVFALGRGLSSEPAPWAVVTRGIGVAAFSLVLVAITATGDNEFLNLGVHVLVYAIGTVAVVIATHEVLRVSLARAIAIGLLAIGVAAASVVLVLPIFVG